MTNGRLSTPTGRTFVVRGCEISIFARKYIQHSESMIGLDRPSNNGIQRTASLAALGPPRLMPIVRRPEEDDLFGKDVESLVYAAIGMVVLAVWFELMQRRRERTSVSTLP